ncbi:hypothetical protein HZA41_02305 [Candidatus Peregrinibacteria bacterium]|nr:hypothetical protein [Candidatus Peregrinibacteria bacterium]
MKKISKRPSLKTSPRDVFLYLLAIITLYISIWRFIALIFEYIHAFFPDEVSWHFTQSSEEIRASMAALIVGFPVYLGITWFLRKDIISHPEKREFWARKWLLHLTLFFAAITIIVDLIILVNNFLNGELTVRFLLKVLTVLIVSATVFGYYFWDLKRDTLPTSKPSKMLAGIISAVVFGSIIAGFFIIGSPATQRKMRFDEMRVNALQSVQWEIINFWQGKSRLPDSLSELKNDISGFVPPTDPETRVSYEYTIKGALEFELCADFSLSSMKNDTSGNADFAPMPTMISKPMGMYGQENWTHSSGRQCFTRMIDPDLYKLAQ